MVTGIRVWNLAGRVGFGPFSRLSLASARSLYSVALRAIDFDQFGCRSSGDVCFESWSLKFNVSRFREASASVSVDCQW